jgi:hypothetical protein
MKTYRGVFLTQLVHAAAIFAVSLRPPLAAHALVLRIARRLPSMTSQEARQAARFLRLGTCLTRAFAVAALVEESTIVIGVQPKGAAIGAHAWIEIDGRVLLSDEVGEEIARLPGRRSESSSRSSSLSSLIGLRATTRRHQDA